MSEMNVRRFGKYLNNANYVAEKASEAYRYYYLLRYPTDEDEWGRKKRLSPLYERGKQMGSVFGAKNGWERVNYYSTKDERQKTTGNWSRPDYFDIVGAEHRTARERVALFDMTSFGKIDVHGRDALVFLQSLADNDLDKPVGAVTYTQFLNERGVIESDLTVTRLGDEHFRIVTGTSFLASDLGWMRLQKQKRDSLEVEFTDVTEQFACLGLWGPQARNVLSQMTTSDLSSAGFPYMTAQHLNVNEIDVWAQRVSYVGELGWGLYCAFADAPKLWDTLLQAGQEFEIAPAGYKALESLRLEKCYRYWSVDVTPGDTPFESGQGYAVKLDKGDFIGRGALLQQKAQGIQRKLVPLTLTDQVVIYGGEAIWYDGRVISRVRSGGYGYSIEKNIALCYLPVELANVGTVVEVQVFGERVPATVSTDPLYDPKGIELKG